MPFDSAYGLYLHIPFCRHRCAYCDFNTYSTLGDLMEPYIAALRRELRQVGGQAQLPAATVYFGGGTPSLLPTEAFQQILADIRQVFDLAPDAEVTVEANPETVSESYLAELRQAGVNRLSLGAQSANSAELALLERGHDFEAVTRAVNAARTAGYTNISLDLIYGLPGQSLASWKQSIGAVLDLEPEHLSLYCLTIEPGTPMNRWLTAGTIQSPDADLAADQYELAQELLGQAGFTHYEISNWAKGDLACQHNLIYWRNESYLGLGAGAHGHAAGCRYSVVRQPRVYIRRMNSEEMHDFPCSAALAEKHQMSIEEMMADTVITQLRLLEEGLALDAFVDRFGVDLFSAYPGVNEQLIEWDLLQVVGHRLLLTARGRFLSNQVFYRFM